MNKLRILFCSALLGFAGLAAEAAPWTLRDCIDYARSRNIQVQSAEVSNSSAGVNLLQAKAQQMPSLSFSMGQGISHGKEEGTSYSGSYALNAGLTIYKGSQLANAVRQQEIRTRSSLLEVAVARNDIEISVTQAYLTILYANENLKTKRQTVEASAAQLERTKALLDAGSLSVSDYAQIEAQYRSDLYDRTVAESTLAQAKLKLKQLLELDLENEFEVAFPEVEDAEVMAAVPALAEVYASATEVMPQVEGSRLEVEAAQVNEKIAKGQKLPTVSLSAAVGTGNFSNSGFSFFNQLSNKLNESATVNVSVPIFNNRSARSAIDLARLETRSSELSHAQVMKDLLSEVESLWQDAVSAQSRFEAATGKLKSAGLSYRLVQEQFDSGMKNAVDLLTEKNNYLSAQQEVIQAKYQSVLSLQLLEFYRGGEIGL